jgi:hypothetical protein
MGVVSALLVVEGKKKGTTKIPMIPARARKTVLNFAVLFFCMIKQEPPDQKGKKEENEDDFLFLNGTPKCKLLESFFC